MATLGVSATLLAMLVALPANAADSKLACANAAEQGQAMRQTSKLRAAREKFIVCARPECPEHVRVDCADWLRQTEMALPTVVLRARDARGNDLIAARVSMDGAPAAASLDGKAVGVDPGPHRFRFEIAGSEPVEVEVLIAEGERNRIVLATFPAHEPATPPPAVTVAQPVGVSAEPPREEPAKRSIGPFVVGGIGLAALAVFGVLDATAWSDVRELRDRCGRAGTCKDDEVDGVSTRITIAKVALAVGAAAVVGGVTWYFVEGASLGARADNARSTRASLSVRPLASGASLEAAASF